MTVLEEFYKKIGIRNWSMCDSCSTTCLQSCWKLHTPRPITLQVERELEELIRSYDTDKSIIFSQDNCYVYSISIMLANSSPHGNGLTRQEALLSLCIKLADELDEEFVTQVKGLIK